MTTSFCVFVVYACSSLMIFAFISPLIIAVSVCFLVGERLKNFFEEKLHFQSEVCRNVLSLPVWEIVKRTCIWLHFYRNITHCKTWNIWMVRKSESTKL